MDGVRNCTLGKLLDVPVLQPPLARKVGYGKDQDTESGKDSIQEAHLFPFFMSPLGIRFFLGTVDLSLM